MKKNTQIDMAKAMKELEEINAWFQEEDVDLDKGLSQLKRAQELTATIQQRLKQAENEFTQIKENFSATDADS